MTEQTQQEYLKSAKATLDVEWDALAKLAGINPRALKTVDFQAVPRAIEDCRT